MNNYYVKLTKEATNQLISSIGFNAEQINLSRGLIKVTYVEDVRCIAEMYEVENVNHKPYEEVMKKPQFVPKPIKDFSLAERKEIIGTTVDIGSIIMLELEEGIEHVVIIGFNEDKYVGARVLLRKPKNDELEKIPLRKGIDVVYRNLTYKDVVTVVSEVAYELDKSDFKNDSGGGIIGRVVNQEILDKLILWNELEAAEKPETVEPVAFEKMVVTAENVEDMISSLWLDEYHLANLARECISNNSRSIKLLVSAMQKNYVLPFTQQQIKELLEKEIEDWSKSMLVEMQECTLPYFLKVIQEQLKEK